MFRLLSDKSAGMCVCLSVALDFVHGLSLGDVQRHGHPPEVRRDRFDCEDVTRFYC